MGRYTGKSVRLTACLFSSVSNTDSGVRDRCKTKRWGLLLSHSPRTSSDCTHPFCSSRTDSEIRLSEKIGFVLGFGRGFGLMTPGIHE